MYSAGRFGFVDNAFRQDLSGVQNGYGRFQLFRENGKFRAGHENDFRARIDEAVRCCGNPPIFSSLSK